MVGKIKFIDSNGFYCFIEHNLYLPKRVSGRQYDMCWKTTSEYSGNPIRHVVRQAMGSSLCLTQNKRQNKRENMTTQTANSFITQAKYSKISEFVHFLVFFPRKTLLSSNLKGKCLLLCVLWPLCVQNLPKKTDGRLQKSVNHTNIVRSPRFFRQCTNAQSFLNFTNNVVADYWCHLNVS